MTEIAEAARGLPDARVRKLVDWIREKMCPDLPPLGTMQDQGTPARWNDTRIIIFTEYDDTKRYLQQQLTAAIATSDRAAERIAVYHGPTPPAEREEIKRAFTTNPKKNPLRILIATDAAREGLNLQTHCWNLFHFDVPWNPSRMEQRNGRIDRKLQPNAEVYCHYFVYTDRKEDRILSVLVRKTELIKKELGSLSQVLEGRLARTLKHGIRHRDIVALATELEGTNPDDDNRQVVEEELEEARERQEDLKAADPAPPEPSQSLARLAFPARRPFPLRHLVCPANDARRSLETTGARAKTGTFPSTASRFPPSISAREPIRPGPRRWTRFGPRASAIRSRGNGGGSRRSVRSCSRTPEPWTRTWSTSTWNTASSSACSAGSPPRDSSTTTFPGPA